MTQHPEDEGRIRSYLLGELTREESQPLEDRLLRDDEFGERLRLVEDELIEDYERGSLAPGERDGFENHFLSTPERRRKLMFVRRISRLSEGALASAAAPRPAPRINSLLAPRWRWAALAALVVLAAVGAWRAFFHQSEVAKGLKALDAAYRLRRPVEGRISGLDYAPWAETRGGDIAPVDQPSLQLAERRLLEAADTSPGAATRHALGKVYLAKREFAQALEQFRAALEADVRNASLHNDSGVALMEQAKLAESSEEGVGEVEKLSEALSHFSRAIELGGPSAEALFNRALCYERLRLFPQAAADWRAYLEIDPDSQWAVEARRKLGRLEAGPGGTAQTQESLWEAFVSAYRAGDEAAAWDAVVRSSCRTGNAVVNRLLHTYLEDSEGGDREGAGKRLRMLEYVGRITARRTGDLYNSDLAKFYGRAGRVQTRGLIRARAAARAGQEQIAAGNFPAALSSYGEAAMAFDRAGDAGEAMQTAYWIAICLDQLNEKEEARASLERLARECQGKSYKWLCVRVLNAIASHQFTLTKYSDSLSTSRRSAQIAEEASDTYGLLSALSFLVGTHRFIGNYAESLGYVRRLLHLTDILPHETKQRWMAFHEVAWVLNSTGLRAAAADYQRAALQLALQLNEPSTINLSYCRLGAIHSEARNHDEAIRNTREAVRIAEAHAGDAYGQRMLAYSSLQLGDVYRHAQDFDNAISSYGRSIELYSKLNIPAFVYQAHKGSLLSHVGSKNIAAAREALATTINLYQQYRANIVEQSNRNSFADVEQSVFDVAVNFEHSTLGNPERAFEYSEAGRARTLIDLMNGEREATPLSLNDVRARLPEEVQILQYVVLEDKLLIWVISREDFRPVVAPISSRRLGEQVRDLLLATRRPGPTAEEASRAGRELYAVLIQRAEAHLSAEKQLFIVPDKFLHLVPFSALISPSSGRYLIEEHTLALAPSTDVLLACTHAARGKARAAEAKALSVGDPAFDREQFPHLPGLPAAAREAREVAALYPETLTLVGKQVTKKRVVGMMREADVIHIASHAVNDEAAPARSRLLLARDSAAVARQQQSDDTLSAAEIYQMGPLSARLVVLSACETAAGHTYRGEGVMSLARPFLVAGVPLVVSSLWAVDSEPTADLMVRFHHYRTRQELPSVKALRLAQLELMKKYPSPYYWASFTVVGGHADF